MEHTVLSFVNTLRADGVEAGRKEAERIRHEADEEAKARIRDAEAKACRIVEEAEQRREKAIEQTRTDLELAARDTVVKLCDALSQAVNRILARAASETLDDAEFLKSLIHDVVRRYAESDASGKETMDLNVSESMRPKLVDWIIKKFHHQSDNGKLSIELHGVLSNAGFEYKLSGGTVEVTPEAIVETLSRVVTPALRELILSSQDGRIAK